MTDRTFDPNTWLDTYRETFASVYKAQQEGFKAVERFARFQYAVAGDYLEAGIAQTQAALGAKTPTELLTKQTELGTRLGEKLRARAQEFSTLASQVQGSVTSFATETANRATETASRASASASKAA
ncbi:MAG: phasin family protein [Steroidobacteraceae bacterium]